MCASSYLRAYFVVCPPRESLHEPHRYRRAFRQPSKRARRPVLTIFAHDDALLSKIRKTLYAIDAKCSDSLREVTIRLEDFQTVLYLLNSVMRGFLLILASTMHFS